MHIWSNYLSWYIWIFTFLNNIIFTFQINQGYFTCGGTLIAKDWVLSAGHCFFGATNPDEWTIVLGDYKIFLKSIFMFIR